MAAWARTVVSWPVRAGGSGCVTSRASSRHRSFPIAADSFVGRERELDEIRPLFREGKRLVTVTGIGGIGKTCLTLQLCLGASDLGIVPQAGNL
jgi:hypothetical protein